MRAHSRFPRTTAATLSPIALAFVAAVLGCDAIPVSNRASDVLAEDGRYISWVEHRIDDSGLEGAPALRGADGLELADFDGDGLEDLVSMHEDSDHLRLSFATPDPDAWISITLAEGELISGIEDPAVADFDDDGDADLIIACEIGRLVYFENPGGAAARTAAAWERVVPDGVEGRGSWIRVYPGRFDARGGLDLIATNKSIPMPSGRGSMDVPDTPVSRFVIEGDPLESGAWREEVIGRYRVPVNARPIDLDVDGRLDVVIGSRGEARMELALNTGEADELFRLVPIEVTNRSIPRPIEGPKMFSGFDMVFEDLSGDGRLDLITFETPWSVVWLEQPEDLDAPWTIHPIAAAFPDSPTALALFDIDGDGRRDLFSGGYSDDPRETEKENPGLFHRAGGLFWFERPEDPKTPWIRHDISRRTRGMYDAFVPRDLNDDGLIDFIGTRGNSGSLDGVLWLEQARTTAPRPVFTSAHAEDSRQLPPTPAWLRALARAVLL